MSTPNNTEPIPLPRCPHCSEEIPALALYSWQSGPWVIMCCYCPNPECRKTLTFQIVPVGIRDESRIQMPS